MGLVVVAALAFAGYALVPGGSPAQKGGVIAQGSDSLPATGLGADAGIGTTGPSKPRAPQLSVPVFPASSSISGPIHAASAASGKAGRLTVRGGSTGTASSATHQASAPPAGGSTPATSPSADPPAAATGPPSHKVPAPPTAVSVTNGKGWAQVSWTPPPKVDTALMAFNVYLGTAPGAESSTPVNGNHPVFGSSYTVNNLAIGPTYYVKVQAYSGAGLSPPSAEASSAPATTATSSPLTGPVAGIATSAGGTGYWLMDDQGHVSAHGTAANYGSAADNTAATAPFVQIVATTDGHGYWELTADGGVFAFGDARDYGSATTSGPNDPAVGLAPTADDHGYWLVDVNGNVAMFGDARDLGTLTAPTLVDPTPVAPTLTAPVVAITLDPATGGYWIVANDGEVFGFDAPSFGSPAGTALAAPVVAMVSSGDGLGYWLAGADGEVFAYGDAVFAGSESGTALTPPVVGLSDAAPAAGYWLAAADGGVFALGAAPFLGSS